MATLGKVNITAADITAFKTTQGIALTTAQYKHIANKICGKLQIGGNDGKIVETILRLLSERPFTGDLITAFTLAEQTGAATIDQNAGTIDIEVAALTDVTALVPTITISDSAIVAPASGVAHNFTTPQYYMVTSEAGANRIYLVTVTVAV